MNLPRKYLSRVFFSDICSIYRQIVNLLRDVNDLFVVTFVQQLLWKFIKLSIYLLTDHESK